MKDRFIRLGLSLYYWAFILLLVVPVFVLVLMSFKNSEFLGFPVEGLTLGWYEKAAANSAFLAAVATSATIAAVSTLMALVIGTWASLALERMPLLLRLPAWFLLFIPLAAPGVISAISFRIFIYDIGLPTGMTAIILAHAVHAVPFVSLMVSARLRHMPSGLSDAARDLGATAFTGFFLVTLPWLKPSLLGASVFGLLLSLDDFNRSFFLGGFEKPIPILVYEKLASGATPELSAFSSIVLFLTIGLGLIGDRILRNSGARR